MWFCRPRRSAARFRPGPPGASDSVRGLGPVIKALKSSSMVVDLTVEGMLHAPELPEIISDGARLFMISNEHPDALERLLPDPALTPKVKAAVKMLRAAEYMTVLSKAGTDLKVDLRDAPTAGVWGYCDRPGTVAHWPVAWWSASPERVRSTARWCWMPATSISPSSATCRIRSS
ncbi:hypothetical protein [uncultured Roseibium sp.]|uniref:hypothetical protein n=1 Tax=uncultured Roseibium sp. TaxID=1936171 RepID=UPI00321623F3